MVYYIDRNKKHTKQIERTEKMKTYTYNVTRENHLPDRITIDAVGKFDDMDEALQVIFHQIAIDFSNGNYTGISYNIYHGFNFVKGYSLSELAKGM